MTDASHRDDCPRASRSVRAYGLVLALLLLVTSFLALLPAADAIGIRPPRAQITFAPETRYDFSVTVINDKDFPIDVETRVEGVLAPHIAIKQPIRIAAKSTAVVPISVLTPASLERPGRQTTYIFFTENYFDAEGGTLSTRTAVGFSLVMWQPYPGSYAEVVASAQSVPEGEDTPLKVLVNNLGTDPIVDGRATVRITNAENVLQDVFTFPNINLPGDTNEDYYDLIEASRYNPGKYFIEAHLDYGANTTNSTSSFAVGTRDIDLLALEGPVYLDKPVNKITVHVESLWNEPLENVYARVSLGSSVVQTVSATLDPFGRAALMGFWETDGTVLPGQVLARVNVSYSGGSREELLPITVEATTPLPPQYEEPSSGIVELSWPDIAMLAFLLIALVLLGIWGVGKLRERRDGKPPANGAAGATSGSVATTPSEQKPAPTAPKTLPGPPKQP